MVYYQSGGVSHSESFSLRRDSATIHQFNDLPAGGIHSISLVAMRQGQNVLAYLPSLVTGPVDPGMFRILMCECVTILFHSCTCSSTSGGGVRRRTRSGWDLIHTELQCQSTQWSGARLS